LSYILGIDIGTTGCKSAVFDTEGNMVSVSSEEYSTLKPAPDASEQEPNQWWEASQRTLRDVLNAISLDENELQSIGICGQMHSAALLDENMEVIRPSITWMDQRSSEEVKSLKEDLGLKKLRSITGNFPTTTYTLPHLLWIKKNDPESFEKIRHVLTPKDFIKFKLTGVLNTEYSDASGTFLMDYEKKEWSDQLLSYLGLSEDHMPSLTESTEVIGSVTSRASEKTGLPKGTPVVAGSADQTAGAIGMGSIRTNQVTSLIGTAGVVSANTSRAKPDQDGRLMCWAHAVPGIWQNLGVMQTSGATLRWFRNNVDVDKLHQNYNQEAGYEEYNRWASKVPPGSEGMLFLPYLEGERTPHWNSKARGIFFGISTNHEKQHFIRAIMEGVGFSLKDSIDLIEDLGTEITKIRVTGGGYRSKVWRQIVADITEKEIQYSNVQEGSAFGVAVLSGVGTGIYSGFKEAIEETTSIEETTRPRENNFGVYRKLHEIYQKLYEQNKELYDELGELKTDKD
jgi:xylulokinase